LYYFTNNNIITKLYTITRTDPALSPASGPGPGFEAQAPEYGTTTLIFSTKTNIRRF